MSKCGMKPVTMMAAGAILFGLLTTASYANESYLCVTEKVTGFIYNQELGDWSATSFNANRRYVVSRARADGFAWEVVQVGETVPSTLCRNDFSPAGNLSCEGSHQFKMNKANRRFLHAYLMGYWSDHNGETRMTGNPFLFKEGENTPFVEIGTCRPL